MAGNAGNAVAIAITDTVIFKAAAAGGAQYDGITSLTIKNVGAVDVLINASGFAATGEYYPLAPGEAMTFGTDTNYSQVTQIQTITAKAVGSVGALSWAATGRR